MDSGKSFCCYYYLLPLKRIWQSHFLWYSKVLSVVRLRSAFRTNLCSRPLYHYFVLPFAPLFNFVYILQSRTNTLVLVPSLLPFCSSVCTHNRNTSKTPCRECTMNAGEGGRHTRSIICYLGKHQEGREKFCVLFRLAIPEVCNVM